eukprot:SAG31_NODE_796_length_12032_cov_21.073242_2_plen_97_part_00
MELSSARLSEVVRHLGIPTSELLEAVEKEGTAAFLSSLQACDASVVRQLATWCTPAVNCVVTEAIFRRATNTTALAGPASTMQTAISSWVIHEDSI